MNGWIVLVFIFLTGNFVLGPILMRRTQEKSKKFQSTHPAESVTKTIETPTQQNIFFILLSLSLVLYALFFFSTALGLTGSDDVIWIFLGLADISVGISFVLKKEIPRNIGFITLATSLFLDGIIIELIALNSDYFPQSLFVYPGLLSLSSGIFLLSKEKRGKTSDSFYSLVTSFL